jgi:hypothetical protein
MGCRSVEPVLSTRREDVDVDTTAPFFAIHFTRVTLLPLRYWRSSRGLGFRPDILAAGRKTAIDRSMIG